MDTDEIETLLEGAEETDILEFKTAMKWDVKSLVKDILAMANLRDGGTIVFGVEDGSFKRRGMSEEQLNTFEVDTMKDQVGQYADPYVSFSLDKPSDRDHRRYAVIRVSSFADVPVICKKDGHDVNKGNIYYRSKTQKPQSAAISNSEDMRKLIDLSTTRRTRYFRGLGYAVNPDNEYDYDAELGEL